MKRIFEDGGERPDIEDISSGAFDFSDVEPEQKPTPPADSPIRTNRPQQESAPPAQPQLTNEQFREMMDRYLSEQQPAAAESAPPADEKKDNPNATGMRIVYQSKDFDQSGSGTGTPRPKKKSLSAFLEEDDDDSLVSDSRFQVAEVTEDDDLFLPRKAPFASSRTLPPTGMDVEEPDKAPAEPAEPAEPDEVPDEPDEPDEPAGPDEADEPENRHLLRTVVLVISLIAIVVSLGILAYEFKLHRDNLKLEAEVSDLVIETSAPGQSVDDVGNNLVLTEEQQWEQIKAEYPSTVFPRNLQLKYARLYATNNDFVGYLEAPALNMTLAVVQTGNDEDYLNKNFYGKSTKYGCPFLSHNNKVSTLDHNTVIYGHHMNDRTIFGALDAYKTLAGYKSCPVISFNTLYRDYNWKVIAAFITNAVAEDDNGYVFNYYYNNLSTDEGKQTYLNEILQRSIYQTGVDVRSTDPLLTLSTCSHEFDNARLVVVARLVRENESLDVDTNLAAINANPRYPQIYYDKKKLNNPYAAAPRWVAG